MNYSLSKIFFGTSKTHLVCDININANISDICCINDGKFIFTSDDTHCIGLIENAEVKFPWIGTIGKNGDEDGQLAGALFDSPIALCLNIFSNICFVIESGGSRIREIEIEGGYVSSKFGANQKKIMDRYFSKIKKEDSKNVACAVCSGDQIYWTVGEINRCFKHTDSTITNFIGSGSAGYSISSDFKFSLLNKPSGICYIGDSIYISDKGNGCIRRVSEESIDLICGSPLRKNSLSPSKILGVKNIIYFICDNNKVKYFSIVSGDMGDIYEASNICSICLDDKNNLFVLERK